MSAARLALMALLAAAPLAAQPTVRSVVYDIEIAGGAGLVARIQPGALTFDPEVTR